MLGQARAAFQPDFPFGRFVDAEAKMRICSFHSGFSWLIVPPSAMRDDDNFEQSFAKMAVTPDNHILVKMCGRSGGTSARSHYTLFKYVVRICVGMQIVVIYAWRWTTRASRVLFRASAQKSLRHVTHINVLARCNRGCPMYRVDYMSTFVTRCISRWNMCRDFHEPFVGCQTDS